MVTEQIPYESALRWLYGSISGGLAADLLFSRELFSKLGTWFSHRSGSQGRVEPFVRQYGISMDQFEDEVYATFNDFFIRRFRAGVRTFSSDPERLPAWAEGACLAWDRVVEEQTFPVKGQHLSPAVLLGSAQQAAPFVGGPLLLIRLRPQDYHRFHFTDAGEVTEQYSIAGRLHSVNMLGLRRRSDILARNKRQVTIQQSQNFGRLAYVEVGAMLVGRIVQQSASQPSRGGEKGYFEYGGSTVAVFGEPGAWKPDADLLEKTSSQMETLIRLGEPIATALLRAAV
jgi:phosphatidylserine decarboxylase